MVVHICNPGYLGGRDRIVAVWGQLAKLAWEPIWKQTQGKRTRGMAQVVERLPSKYEARNSIPNTEF
jgi:hypothetical protein